MPFFKAVIGQSAMRYYRKTFEAPSENAARKLARTDAESGLNNWTEIPEDYRIDDEFLSDIQEVDEL